MKEFTGYILFFFCFCFSALSVYVCYWFEWNRCWSGMVKEEWNKQTHPDKQHDKRKREISEWSRRKNCHLVFEIPNKQPIHRPWIQWCRLNFHFIYVFIDFRHSPLNLQNLSIFCSIFWFPSGSMKYFRFRQKWKKYKTIVIQHFLNVFILWSPWIFFLFCFFVSFSFTSSFMKFWHVIHREKASKKPTVTIKTNTITQCNFHMARREWGVGLYKWRASEEGGYRDKRVCSAAEKKRK